MVVHRRGKGDQNGGTPGSRQFGDAGSAGTADHKMAGGKPRRHVIEEGLDLGIDANVEVACDKHVALFRAALLDDAKAAAKTIVKLRHRIRYKLGENTGTKRPADHHQRQPVMRICPGRPAGKEGGAYRHSGQEAGHPARKVAGAGPAQRQMPAPARQQVIGTPEMGVLFMQHRRHACQPCAKQRRKGRITAKADHRGWPAAQHHGHSHRQPGGELDHRPATAHQTPLER